MNKLYRTALLALCALPAAAQTTWCPLDRGGFGDGANLLAAGAVEYGGELYCGTFNPSGAQLWRYNGSWSPVAIPGLSSNNEAILPAVVFQGELFVGTLNSTNGAEVWSFDGANWTQEGSAGLGAGPLSPAVDQLAVFNAELYAGLDHITLGTQIRAFQAGAWNQVNVSGFGCGNDNDEAYGLTVYAGQLYATTGNDNGTEIWRWDGSSPWQRIDPGAPGCGGGGFGDGGAQTGAHALHVAGTPAALYVGTEHAAGAEVWRYDGSWSQVSINGFGNTDNFIVHDFEEFDGQLIAVTENGNTGCEVWAYDFVNSWTRIDPGAPSDDGGFGSSDLNEIGFELATYGGRLIATTFNAFGGSEVWVLGIGTTFCSTNLNSTGRVGRLCAEGSEQVLDNDLTLLAYDLPLAQFGYFLASMNPTFIANPGGSQGNLCMGAPQLRITPSLANTGTAGSYSWTVNLANVDSLGGGQPGVDVVQAGQTWHFQGWYRDANPGPTSNFTEAVSIDFQ